MMMLLDPDRPPQRNTLRLSIDGTWSAQEMAESFTIINYLYNLRIFLEIQDGVALEYEHFFPIRHFRKRGIPFPPFPLFPFSDLTDASQLKLFAETYSKKNVLQVSRVDFASPGNKDFLGVGEILTQLREFVQFLIMLPQEKERMNLENNAVRIKNARNFLRLRREASEAEIEIAENEILAQMVDDKTKPLVKLIEQKKITDSQILD